MTTQQPNHNASTLIFKKKNNNNNDNHAITVNNVVNVKQTLSKSIVNGHPGRGKSTFVVTSMAHTYTFHSLLHHRYASLSWLEKYDLSIKAHKNLGGMSSANEEDAGACRSIRYDYDNIQH